MHQDVHVLGVWLNSTIDVMQVVQCMIPLQRTAPALQLCGTRYNRVSVDQRDMGGPERNSRVAVASLVGTQILDAVCLGFEGRGMLELVAVLQRMNSRRCNGICINSPATRHAAAGLTTFQQAYLSSGCCGYCLTPHVQTQGNNPRNRFSAVGTTLTHTLACHTNSHTGSSHSITCKFTSRWQQCLPRYPTLEFRA
jgi:hypothetical protein